MYTHDKSQELLRRATKVIPGGIYGQITPRLLIPNDAYPLYWEKAQGSRFTDVDGNEYIDYMGAYGPIGLGYNHPKVEAAANAQREKGGLVTGANPVMIELAELLVDTISIADWAFFAKNGADVTTLATMTARASTGREKLILVSHSYHGTAGWMMSPGSAGTTTGDHTDVIYVDWNDLDGLKKVVHENKGEIAGFMAAPYDCPSFGDSVLPAEGYWKGVEELCRNEGIVIIVDDVRCGFRLDLRGSHEYFSFKPDLVCMSKAIANGHCLAALVGTAEMKEAVESFYYTGTFWFDAVAMAASVATLHELRRIDAPKVMQATGQKLVDGMREIAESHGHVLKATGPTSMPYVRLEGENWIALTQQWCGEATRRGVYFTSHHCWFVSTAHTEEDIQQTLTSVEDAFVAIGRGDR
jgi:glutamate-1-semialdehyde 2,1-aminomutase